MTHSRRGICRSCGAELLWARMAGSGKLAPLNREPRESGNVVIVDGEGRAYRNAETAEAEFPGREKFVSHFADCPQRRDWRKPE